MKKNLTAKQAAQVAYLNDFLNALSQISNSRKIKGMPMPPCMKAHDELEAESIKIGIPMKSVIKGGKKGGDQVMYEIISIKTNGHHPIQHLIR